jgi:hypothetical protein
LILVDKIGHLVSEDSEEDLHEFAKKLGLKRSWYQDGKHPHYDLTAKNKIYDAIAEGARRVSPRELVKRAWWNK